MGSGGPVFVLNLPITPQMMGRTKSGHDEERPPHHSLVMTSRREKSNFCEKKKDGPRLPLSDSDEWVRDTRGPFVSSDGKLFPTPTSLRCSSLFFSSHLICSLNPSWTPWVISRIRTEFSVWWKNSFPWFALRCSSLFFSHKRCPSLNPWLSLFVISRKSTAFSGWNERFSKGRPWGWKEMGVKLYDDLFQESLHRGLGRLFCWNEKDYVKKMKMI